MRLPGKMANFKQVNLPDYSYIQLYFVPAVTCFLINVIVRWSLLSTQAVVETLSWEQRLIILL
jgi:hypothetical protein